MNKKRLSEKKKILTPSKEGDRDPSICQRKKGKGVRVDQDLRERHYKKQAGHYSMAVLFKVRKGQRLKKEGLPLA